MSTELEDPENSIDSEEIDQLNDSFSGHCQIFFNDRFISKLKEMKMSFLNGLILIGSAFLNAYDVYSDANIVYSQYQLYQKHEYPIWPFCWTLTILFSCALLKIAVSFFLYIDFDHKLKRRVTKVKWLCRLILHLFLIAPTFRFLEAFYHGVKCNMTINSIIKDYKNSRTKVKALGRKSLILVKLGEHSSESFTMVKKKDLNGAHVLYKTETLIASYLYVLETYLETAPQLIHQIFIFINYQDFTKHQLVLVISSIASIAWSLVSHFRTEEEIGFKYNPMSWMRSGFWAVFQFFFIASRILSLSLFASVFPYHILPLCLIHWIFMMIFISNFFFHGTTSRLNKHALISVFGLIYIFNFVNLNIDRLHQGCFRIYSYHFIMFIENTALVSLWFVFCGKPSTYYIPLLITHYVSFAIGLILMITFFSGVSLSEKLKVIKQMF